MLQLLCKNIRTCGCSVHFLLWSKLTVVESFIGLLLLLLSFYVSFQGSCASLWIRTISDEAAEQ